MSIPGKVLIALLSAAVVSALWSTFSADLSILQVFGPSAAAAVLAVALSHRALPMPSAIASSEVPAEPGKPAGPGERHRKEPRSDNKKPSRKAKAPQSDTARGKQKTSKAEVSTANTGTEKEPGTVKWFNGTKGFGFIVRESGEEVFVHHRSIEGEGRRSLRDGAAVRFRVVDTEKGPQAEDVEAVDQP